MSSFGPQTAAPTAKVRLPGRGHDAILINTGGGLAGGDRFTYEITAEDEGHLTLTSQAAERVYRTLGPAAEVDVRLQAGAKARLMWLPQETILFDGAALTRSISAELSASATLLAVESVILGREAMGEELRHVRLRDRWRIRQEGRDTGCAAVHILQRLPISHDRQPTTSPPDHRAFGAAQPN